MFTILGILFIIIICFYYFYRTNKKLTILKTSKLERINNKDNSMILKKSKLDIINNNNILNNKTCRIDVYTPPLHIIDNRIDCWVDLKTPELDRINNNINIIIDELNNILRLKKKWSKWAEYEKDNTPSFFKMSNKEIENRLIENEDHLNTTSPSWRIFVLKVYGQNVEKYSKYCPKTLELFKNIDYVYNIGYSCLEPFASTHLHRDWNDKILRCHFPLIIPEGDCAIYVANKMEKWVMGEYFIFDDTCHHVAWNNTDSNRFILIVDIDKEKFKKYLK